MSPSVVNQDMLTFTIHRLIYTSFKSDVISLVSSLATLIEDQFILYIDVMLLKKVVIS